MAPGAVGMLAMEPQAVVMTDRSNQLFNTDAQERPLPLVAPVLGRRLHAR